MAAFGVSDDPSSVTAGALSASLAASRAVVVVGHTSDPAGTENAIKGTPASIACLSRPARASIVSPGTGRSSRRYSVPS